MRVLTVRLARPRQRSTGPDAGGSARKSPAAGRGTGRSRHLEEQTLARMPHRICPAR